MDARDSPVLRQLDAQCRHAKRDAAGVGGSGPEDRAAARVRAPAEYRPSVLRREGPLNRAFQHSSEVLCERRSSGSGRQQLPVLGQNDRIDGMYDAIRRNDIGLGDPSPIDSHVR